MHSVTSLTNGKILERFINNSSCDFIEKESRVRIKKLLAIWINEWRIFIFNKKTTNKNLFLHNTSKQGQFWFHDDFKARVYLRIRYAKIASEKCTSMNKMS